jgi:hypothetical protein
MRIISTVLLWGLVISAGVALRRYLTGAQRTTALPAQMRTSERVGVKQPVSSEIDDEPDYRQRVDLDGDHVASAEPAGQQRGVVAGAGADLQHPLTWLCSAVGQHLGHDRRHAR